MSSINLHLGDSLEAMRKMPDNAYDLAIVDPPYGLGKKLAHAGNGKNAQSKFANDFKAKNWDNEIPSNEYFEELKRISKNQIIWGGNYFPLPPTRCFICWDKMVYIPSMSRIEQAWTSFDKLPQLVQYNNNDSNRIHLTQKPINLYEWLLTNYAKEADKILDTHFGSGSHGIACGNLGFDLDAYELDEDYFNAAHKRIEQHFSQLNAFQEKPIITVFK
jgi:site-specific DNA-methyltransferase (adenine-specific)